MKKNYTCPMVEVNAFDVEDVVMLSGTGLSQEFEDKHGDKLNQVKATFKANVRTETAGNGIVVEW